mgnify:CR=1 FL=1
MQGIYTVIKYQLQMVYADNSTKTLPTEPFTSHTKACLECAQLNRAMSDVAKATSDQRDPLPFITVIEVQSND